MQTKEQIEQNLKSHLTKAEFTARGSRKKYPLTADAWYVGVVAGPVAAESRTSMNRLRDFAKWGHFCAIMTACADLGKWWLAQKENAKHLMRADVESRIKQCEEIAAAA